MLARRRRKPPLRYAVLAAALAVPAMANPPAWQFADAGTGSGQPAPMGFETPGESFPGSAFYYLADQPYAPLPIEAEIRSDAEPAPSPAAADENLAAAHAFRAAGTAADRLRAEQCLAMAIYYEAASESDAGQRAVAQVVLNRVAHPSYPDTVCGVVFQGSERTTGCQFTFTCDGSLARRPARMWWERALGVARAALAGAVYAPVGLATHYHTFQVHPYWADSLDRVTTIGAHIFYRWRGAAGRRAAFLAAYRGGEPAAAPHRRSSAPAAASEADPLALARAFASAPTAPAEGPGPVTGIGPSPAYSDEISARGGDALFRADRLPGGGALSPALERSGRWLARPEPQEMPSGTR